MEYNTNCYTICILLYFMFAATVSQLNENIYVTGHLLSIWYLIIKSIRTVYASSMPK